METRNWAWEFCVVFLEHCGITFDPDADLDVLRFLAQRYRKIARRAGVLDSYEGARLAYVRSRHGRDQDETAAYHAAVQKLRRVCLTR